VSRSCGVASVEPDRNSVVWGVVFQIDELEVGRLDKAEGYEPDGQRTLMFEQNVKYMLMGMIRNRLQHGYI